MSYFGIGYGNIPTASPEEIRRAVEDVAPAIIEEQIGTVVDDSINAAFRQAEATGKMNDVREYESRDAFPETGITGVEYVDKSTDKEYIWDGGAYVILDATKPVTDTDIDTLPAWN